jgi:phage-related protein
VAPPGNTIDAAATLGAFRGGMTLLDEALKNLQAGWNLILDKVRAVLTKLEKTLNTDGPLDSIWEFLTDDLKDAISAINSLIGKLQTVVDQVLEKVRKAVGGAVPVLSLMDTAVKYPDAILKPFTNIGVEMEKTGDIVYWGGPTKEAYNLRVKEQVGAVDETAATIRFASEWLAEVGSANTTYIASVAKKAAEVAGVLTAATIDATMAASGLVIQVPSTLEQLSETIGEAVNQLLQYGADLADYLMASVRHVTTNANERNDHTGMGTEGHWPTIKS